MLWILPFSYLPSSLLYCLGSLDSSNDLCIAPNLCSQNMNKRKPSLLQAHSHTRSDYAARRWLSYQAHCSSQITSIQPYRPWWGAALTWLYCFQDWVSTSARFWRPSPEIVCSMSISVPSSAAYIKELLSKVNYFYPLQKMLSLRHQSLTVILYRIYIKNSSYAQNW